MSRSLDPPESTVPPPGHRPTSRLGISESSGTVVIAVRGSLDAGTALEVHQSVVSQMARTDVAAVEIDLREMDRWTSAGLRGLGACAARRVRFRMGPRVAPVSH